MRHDTLKRQTRKAATLRSLCSEVASWDHIGLPPDGKHRLRQAELFADDADQYAGHGLPQGVQDIPD